MQLCTRLVSSILTCVIGNIKLSQYIHFTCSAIRRYVLWQMSTCIPHFPAILKTLDVPAGKLCLLDYASTFSCDSRIEFFNLDSPYLSIQILFWFIHMRDIHQSTCDTSFSYFEFIICHSPYINSYKFISFLLLTVFVFWRVNIIGILKCFVYYS